MKGTSAINVASVIILVFSLLGFEVFNFAATEYSLNSLTGGVEFFGFRWATLIALAFCGVDIAGLARIFTPERGSDEPKEILFLFVGWLLAAAFNAILSWWGILQALLIQGVSGNVLVPQVTIVKWFPVFAAFMILVVRLLLIGSLVTAFEGHHAGGKPKAKTEAKPKPAPEVRERPQPTMPAKPERPAPQGGLASRFNDKGHKQQKEEPPDRLFGDLIGK